MGKGKRRAHTLTASPTHTHTLTHAALVQIFDGVEQARQLGGQVADAWGERREGRREGWSGGEGGGGRQPRISPRPVATTHSPQSFPGKGPTWWAGGSVWSGRARGEQRTKNADSRVRKKGIGSFTLCATSPLRAPPCPRLPFAQRARLRACVHSLFSTGRQPVAPCVRDSSHTALSLPVWRAPLCAPHCVLPSLRAPPHAARS